MCDLSILFYCQNQETSDPPGKRLIKSLMFACMSAISDSHKEKMQRMWVRRMHAGASEKGAQDH